MILFICQRILKTVKCQGKIRKKSGNFEVDDKWQPVVARSNGLIDSMINLGGGEGKKGLYYKYDIVINNY